MVIKLKIKKVGCLLLTIVFCTCFVTGQTVAASGANFTPYRGYEYDSNGNSTAAPTGYEPSRRFVGKDLGLEDDLNEPTDIYYDNKDTVYLLDSNNSRVIALNTDFKVKKVYSNFVDTNGSKITFNEAQGFTVDSNGTIYIADTKNNRVLIINQDCVVTKILLRPDNVLTNTGMPFAVTKVLSDNNNQILILAPSINLGAFVYTKDGEFVKFYGSNEVSLSIGETISGIFSKFLTKEGKKSLLSKVPASFSNFDIDSRGFIYTVTDTADNLSGAVRRLNFQGSETLSEKTTLGDLEIGSIIAGSKTHNITQFTDVDVDSAGFINLLDKSGGKVFQYTENGQLVSIFGTYGNQLGTFAGMAAIESIGDKVYVVDSLKNCVYEFSPNAYGSLYRSAIAGLNTYDLDGSLEKWQEILKRNTNSMYAYEGMGLVYDAMGEYSSSMYYFKSANDVSDYSNSFQQYRSQVMQKYWPLALLALAAVISIVVLIAKLYFKYTKVPDGKTFSPMESKKLLPFYCIFHPIDGFEQMKLRRIDSKRNSGIIIFLLLAVTTFSYFCTGFIFNTHAAGDYNTIMVLLQTVGMFVLFVISNWAVCTLFDGKGRLGEIISMTAYALIPYISTVFINVFLSNILIESEGTFITVVAAMGFLWSGIVLILGLMTIHQYSFSKTLLFFIATILGMAIIAFLVVLFFTLIHQTYGFAKSIIQEAMLK